MLAPDDFLELVEDDVVELGHGLPLELGPHPEVHQWVLHKGGEPVGEGHKGEGEAQAPHHWGQLDEEIAGLAEDQVHVYGQAEAPIVLHLHLEDKLCSGSGGQCLPLEALELQVAEGPTG